MTTSMFDAIRTNAQRDGEGHATGILAAHESGAILEVFATLDDVIDEWGALDHLTYACDILPGIIPDAWTEWTVGEWTPAIDDAAHYAMRYYRECFARAFAARVYADTARWHAVAVAVRCPDQCPRGPRMHVGIR